MRGKDTDYSLTEGALEAGFDEYIIKPVEFEDMRKLIRRYFTETERKK